MRHLSSTPVRCIQSNRARMALCCALLMATGVAKAQPAAPAMPAEPARPPDSKPAAPADSNPWPRTTSDVYPMVSPLELEGDDVYGRFDGDLDLGFGAGAHVADEPALLLRASAHDLSTLGVVIHYTDRLGLDSEEGDRTLGVAGELRPLFLLRWSLGLEEGPAWLDLTVDSLSLGVGYYLQNPGSRADGDARGMEVAVGMGVPLMGTANGLWLRARGQLRFGGDDIEPSLFLMLTWQSLLVSPWIGR